MSCFAIVYLSKSLLTLTDHLLWLLWLVARKFPATSYNHDVPLFAVSIRVVQHAY